jgi:hypothetical protein
LFFLGAENHVPSSGKMRCAGHFWCTRTHDVLLRIGPGPRQGDPAIVSVPYYRGRIPFTLCEPHWQNDWWLIDVVLGWVARGAPLPAP